MPKNDIINGNMATGRAVRRIHTLKTLIVLILLFSSYQAWVAGAAVTEHTFKTEWMGIHNNVLKDYDELINKWKRNKHRGCVHLLERHREVYIMLTEKMSLLKFSEKHLDGIDGLAFFRDLLMEYVYGLQGVLIDKPDPQAAFASVQNIKRRSFLGITEHRYSIKLLDRIIDDLRRKQHGGKQPWRK